MHIGYRLKKLREEKNLSQKTVSIGIVSTSHYSNIENGRFEPSNEVLLLLAERLEVPSEYLHRIREENVEIQKYLMEYEMLIASSEGNIDSFLKKNHTKFIYIVSLKQEVMFNLLKYLEHLKFGRINEAQKHYVAEIACIPQKYIAEANLQMLEKYQYVTGLHHYYTRNYADSILHFKEALHLTKDELLSAKINYNIALALYQEHDYGTALNYTKKALGQYMDLHCWKQCGDCYNLVAALYLEQYKVDEAKKYIEKGFSIIADEMTGTLANLYHNLAIFYFIKKDFMQALEKVNRSLEVKKALEVGNLFATKKLKIEILFELEDFQAIQSCLGRLRKMASSDLEQAHLHKIDALLYYSMREYEQFERLMIHCTEVFLENKQWVDLKESSHHLALYYVNQKKYKSAYTYQEYGIHAYRHIVMELKGGDEL